MNYLILHRIPYSYINYADILDHDQHTVVYIGTLESLQNIPNEISCVQIARPGNDKTYREVIRIIEQLKLSFDVVISLSEYELMDAAKIREALSIQGQYPGQVEKVRNKILMKSLVSQAGLRAPRYIRFDELMGSLEQIRDWGTALIFKQ